MPAAAESAPPQVLAFYYGWWGNPTTSGRWVHWQDVDAASRQIRMTFLDPPSAAKRFDGSYELEDGGRVRLRGVLDERAVEIQLVRKR